MIEARACARLRASITLPHTHSPSLSAAAHADTSWLRQCESMDHSYERDVSLVRVSPLADWDISGCRSTAAGARSFHSTNIHFRFQSLVEEKWTDGQGHKGRTCPL